MSFSPMLVKQSKQRAKPLPFLLEIIKLNKNKKHVLFCLIFFCEVRDLLFSLRSAAVQSSLHSIGRSDRLVLNFPRSSSAHKAPCLQPHKGWDLSYTQAEDRALACGQHKLYESLFPLLSKEK